MDERPNKDQTIKAKEALEARLYDASERSLSDEAKKQLLADLKPFPELTQAFLGMMGTDGEEGLFASIPKSVFNESQMPVIKPNFSQSLSQKMDNEVFWLATILQIKGLIYKFMMPVMAASLLLFVQVGEQNAETTSLEDSQTVEDLTGYEALSTFHENLQDYAGLAELDALITELDEPKSTLNSPN
jgi:hypothetical protein